MKTSFFIAVFLLSANALACFGEARVSATIDSVRKNSYQSCLAFIDMTAVKHFSVNQACPLDLIEIATMGVEVGIKDGHDCALEAGDELNGIVTKDSTHRLSLIVHL